MSKIYTKTGDKGITGTFLGRMAKSDLLPEVLGTIDELNSAVGLARSTYSNSPLTPLFVKERGTEGVSLDIELKKIQTNLLTIGSSLSGSGLKINSVETKNLEKLIDKITKELPKLTNFIYPTGPLQMARAVCRRAERKVVELGADKNILKYLNRLSDALFTLARFVNYKSGITEEVWKV